MCTINNTGGTPFGPDGCQVPVGKGTCGETRTLEIINEFKRLYEEKLHEIDTTGGGDCLQEKIKLQQDWIGDLTEQNEMLIRAVEELEHEATERVHILEEKLHQSAQCICEEQMKVKDRECTISGLQSKLDFFNSFGNVEVISKELKCKKEECETLKKTMEDTQQALVEEVATKHDQIIQLKREVQQLEERCIQADKQTAFRDDIIKELRKEIKQLKQQASFPEKISKMTHTVENAGKPKTEPYLIINHTRKIVQSGKSTVIYLRNDAVKNSEEINSKNLTSLYEKHANSCSKCRQKFDNELIVQQSKEVRNNYKELEKNFDKALHLCKSENDLYDFKKLLKPVKDRSKFTTNALNRCNTFVGCTKDVLKNIDFDSRLKKKNVSVPNHIPVKMYVNNIEISKNKK